MKILLILLQIIIFTTNMDADSKTEYICYDKWPNAMPPYHFTPNKCGPDSPLAKIIPNKFGTVDLGEACNKHDICWMELKDYNKYGRCEQRLFKDLVKACNEAEMCFHGNCVPNPAEIAACQSMIPPSYTAAATAGLLFKYLEETREEQKEFEACVKKYGYKKRK